MHFYGKIIYIQEKENKMRKNLGVKPYMFPQPVLIIGTYDKEGKPNAMNAAWGGIVDTNQIIICLSSHKTTDNILYNKEFSVAMADVKHVAECDYLGIVSGHQVDNKIEKCRFTTRNAEFVNAPIINELPLALECKLINVMDEEKYLAEIVNVSVDETILGEDGKVNIEQLNPIVYDIAHHGYYKLGQRVGQAFEDGKKIK